MFQTTGYRILLPTPALEALVSRYPQAQAGQYNYTLLEPEIWSFPDNSHHTLTLISIYKLKLMFLVDLYTDYVHDATVGMPIRSIIQEICGEPPFLSRCSINGGRLRKLLESINSRNTNHGRAGLLPSRRWLREPVTNRLIDGLMGWRQNEAYASDLTFVVSSNVAKCAMRP